MSQEISTRYAPQEVEDKWYAHWEKSGYFHAEPDEREPFSIVIPPPNVTGVLHMGHMLNNTVQDILIRKARKEGKNACWVPGTDHASIATEAKVVQMLRERGIKKADLSREEFLAYAWEWKEKYGGIILQQLRKLGASCDWERTAFTMDELRSEGVLKVFVDLYNAGKLYRGKRMVNWDPEAKTVLSNEEVLVAEENSQLFHVRYKVDGTENEWVTIATQRPETIMADTGLAVNPTDERYAHLKGKKVIVPLVNRAVPIIFDDYVDKEFGTGALKVTPAHDPNDYELGQKYGLEVIDSLNDDGTLNELCEIPELVGKDRFVARKMMKKILEESGNLVEIKDYRTNIPRSERTNAVVEPRLSLQWFVDMQQIVKPALDAVMTDDIEFFPKNLKNTYRSWMENIRDWCISRQLWWGHRIPAWYDQHGNVFVALTEGEAKEKAALHYLECNISGEATLKQDEDVLDTWFSSWLWPITVFDGFNDSKDFKYYYPTSVLVTGWDIMFFWVARMAMAGFEWYQERPFKQVYFTGMVRDKQGRKMSKSLGNSPEALKLIEEFGADGMRFGVLSSSPAGGDLKFDEKLCEQGRNFCNKLWNAMRLIKGWEVTKTAENEDVAKINALAIDWFTQKMSQTIHNLQDLMKEYRLSEAVVTMYSFIWDDFCSWYLEMVKPSFGKPIDRKTLEATTAIFKDLMSLMHPFMPFVTEEIWNQLSDGQPEQDCCVSPYPTAKSFDPKFIAKVEAAKDLISKIRDTRNANGIKMAEKLTLLAQKSDNALQLQSNEGWKALVMKLGNLESLELVENSPENAISFLSATEQYYIESEKTIDVEQEKIRLTKELEYAKGFVNSVLKKLENERFVSNAPPQVLEMERKKLADGQAKVQLLEDVLAKLG